MLADVVEFLNEDFGATAAILAVIAFVSTLPSCFRRKSWPEVGATIVMLLGVGGTFAGIKICILTICLPVLQLGSLANDKPALLMGGIVTFLVSLRAAVEHWHHVTKCYRQFRR